VPGAEDGGEPERDRHRRQAHDGCAQQPDGKGLPQPAITHGNVRARDEHHESEADRRHECQRGLVRAHRSQHHRAERHARHELADDDRQTEPARHREQRAGQACDADEREETEAHGAR
jgi:hypothetical protein